MLLFYATALLWIFILQLFCLPVTFRRRQELLEQHQLLRTWTGAASISIWDFRVTKPSRDFDDCDFVFKTDVCNEQLLATMSCFNHLGMKDGSRAPGGLPHTRGF